MRILEKKEEQQPLNIYFSGLDRRVHGDVYVAWAITDWHLTPVYTEYRDFSPDFLESAWVKALVRYRDWFHHCLEYPRMKAFQELRKEVKVENESKHVDLWRFTE